MQHDPQMSEDWLHEMQQIVPLGLGRSRKHHAITAPSLRDIKQAIRTKHEQRERTAHLLEDRVSIGAHRHACLLDTRLKRRIAKGKEKIEATFDLHGLTLAAAHTQLQHFLMLAYHQRLRTVLIITGKGKDGEGILRTSVPHWLDHAASQHIVQNYDSASVGHGGSGAYYVRLRAHTQGGSPHEHF